MTNVDDGVARFEEIVAKEKERSSLRRKLTAGSVGILIATGCGFALWAIKQHRIIEGADVQIVRARTEAKTSQAQVAQAEKNVDVSNFVTSGRERFERGDWDGALAEYDKALQIAPGNPQALQAKGYLLFRRGKLDEAISLLNQSAENDPEYEWAHYNLALVYWKVGSSSAALGQVQQVLRLDASFIKTFRTDVNFGPYIRSSPEFRKLLDEASKTPKSD